MAATGRRGLFLHEHIGACRLAIIHIHVRFGDLHDYHYYYGHVMWDIETFSVLPLMLLQPEPRKSCWNFAPAAWSVRAARPKRWGDAACNSPGRPRRAAARKLLHRRHGRL